MAIKRLESYGHCTYRSRKSSHCLAHSRPSAVHYITPQIRGLASLEPFSPHLSRPSHRISRAGVFRLTNSTLEELDLSHNDIANHGVFGLTEVLMANVALRFLNLGSCGIEDEGLCAVAEGVAASKSLATLLLWGNKFAQRSASAFLAIAREREELQTDFLPYQVDDSVLVASC